MDWTRFDDCRRVQVVGRQFHQPALIAASHRQVSGTNRWECTAELRREPSNDHDPKAIQVFVEGHVVGYVKRGTAKRLNSRLAALEEEGKLTTCPVFIRHDGGQLQAHLQIPYASELLKGYKNTKGKR